jgi:hypothetical protein
MGIHVPELRDQSQALDRFKQGFPDKHRRSPFRRSRIRAHATPPTTNNEYYSANYGYFFSKDIMDNKF